MLIAVTESVMSSSTPIRKNDNVLVITGKDRGKRGRVLKVLPGRRTA